METEDKEGGRILVETRHSQSVSVVKIILAGSAKTLLVWAKTGFCQSIYDQLELM